jgi:unsaturated rhamnogalacturonyl hydrolase
MPVGATGEPANNPVLGRVLRERPAGRISSLKHPGEWSYEEGVLLDGVIAMWQVTGDGRLFNYVRAAVDRSIDANGVVHMDDAVSGLGTFIRQHRN